MRCKNNIKTPKQNSQTKSTEMISAENSGINVSRKRLGAFPHAPSDKHRPAVPFGTVRFVNFGAVYGELFGKMLLITG